MSFIDTSPECLIILIIHRFFHVFVCFIFCWVIFAWNQGLFLGFHYSACANTYNHVSLNHLFTLVMQHFLLAAELIGCGTQQTLFLEPLLDALPATRGLTLPEETKVKNLGDICGILKYPFWNYDCTCTACLLMIKDSLLESTENL